ncbi:MAG TPA: response regulator [Burkholderiaceae bacterium]|nr:response regulator [Burkholderiaceae bacterium]
MSHARPATNRSFRVALEGFGETEHALLSSHLRFDDGHGPAYVPVHDPAQGELRVVDADQPHLVQRVVAERRLGDTVFVGAGAPPHAIARIARPIEPALIRRELDHLIAQRTVRIGLDIELPLVGSGVVGSPPVDLLLHDLAPPDTADEKSAPRAGHGGGRAALVVDDSPIARKFLTTRLQRLGYVVQAAADGEQALEIAARERFVIAFIDVNLGRAASPDGLELCQQLRQRANERGLPAPAVVLVADRGASASERVRASLVGCDGYLTKPLLEPEFLEVLSTADPPFRQQAVAAAS